MNEQLAEAVHNLLSIDPVHRTDFCDQCNEREYDRFGIVGGQPVCEGCIRQHAALVLEHSEALQCSGR